MMALRAVTLALALCAPWALQAQETPPDVLLLDMAALRSSVAKPANTDPAARRIAVTLDPGITSIHDLPTTALRDARKRMLRDGGATLDDLRALADAGDGLAALRLVNAWKDTGTAPDLATQAKYYDMMARAGRVSGLSGLVRVLDRIDPSALKDPARSKETLLAYAAAGNTVAIGALLRFQSFGRPFGDMSKALRAVPNFGPVPAMMNPSDLAALQQASDLIQRHWADPAGLAQAKALLTQARQAQSLRIQLIAGNMLPVLNARIATLNATKANG